MKTISLIKNKNNIYIFLAIATFIAIMFISYKKIEKQASINNINTVSTIIIDAGHGGEDGGATSKGGLVEKDINLDIAKYLEPLLSVSGFNVKMIRNEDIAIYDEKATTIKEKKTSDLKNRLQIINSNEDAILVSIHQNKFEQSKYNGAQIFYSKNNSNSKDLANCIKKSIVGLIQPDNTREIKPAEKNIFILYNAKIPAVIVECGFLSNPEEEKKLSTDTYKKQVAFSIYCGIMEYQNNKVC